MPTCVPCMIDISFADCLFRSTSRMCSSFLSLFFPSCLGAELTALEAQVKIAVVWTVWWRWRWLQIQSSFSTLLLLFDSVQIDSIPSLSLFSLYLPFHSSWCCVIECSGVWQTNLFTLPHSFLPFHSNCVSNLLFLSPTSRTDKGIAPANNQTRPDQTRLDKLT